LLVLRQAVGDLVVVVLLGGEDVFLEMGAPVGSSKAPVPTAMKIVARGVSQNKPEPHTEQNPRCALSDERYQASLFSPKRVREKTRAGM
jgi:hypothetical protein